MDTLLLRSKCLGAFLLFCLPMRAISQTPVVFGNGNMGGANITTSHNQGTPTGDKLLDGKGFLPNEVAASRFLAQATLGADFETIMAMANTSYSEWLDAQFATPRLFSIEQYTKDILAEAVDSTYEAGGNPNSLTSQLFHWHSAWWQYAMTSPDLLRNRIALALSEIFVVSEIPRLGDVPISLPNYYDMLANHAFGNFRDLLGAVTLHPGMGIYLTYMNNPKANPAFNRYPDENYAREAMQLFTIGLYELNPDGTRQLDSLGNFIQTYDNDDIAEFAKVFTGLTWGDAFAFGQGPFSAVSYTQPMKMFNSWHEPGPKHLLNGFTVPDRNPVNGMADVNDALDNLFNHPNVGPFIGRLLIQRLVTSNPSHAYIGRVAAAFNNNGQGVRGDLKAVIRAILLDEEARDCSLIADPERGMLREPIVRYAHAARAFNAYSDRGIYRNAMQEFYSTNFQRTLASPSVFNFFLPDYQPIGPIADADMVAPEFQIANSVTIAGYANQLKQWIFDEYVMEFWGTYNGEWWGDKIVRYNLTDEMQYDELAEVNLLLERLNLILFHGQMSDQTREIIRSTLLQIPQENQDDWGLRVKMAIYLSMISPDYLILR